MASAATRPWRFAGPASGTSSHWPVTQFFTSTASPIAQMFRSLVRIWSSTRMPPRSPISSPALRANCVSGRTPMESTTSSASNSLPLCVRTIRPSLPLLLKSHTPSPRMRFTPCDSRRCRAYSAISASSGGITWLAISITVTAMPRCIKVLSHLQTDESASDNDRHSRLFFRDPFANLPAVRTHCAE